VIPLDATTEKDAQRTHRSDVAVDDIEVGALCCLQRCPLPLGGQHHFSKGIPWLKHT